MTANKKKLTRRDIIKALRLRSHLLSATINTSIGWVIMILAIINCNNVNAFSVIRLIFIFVLIYFPFGIIFGLGKIVNLFDILIILKKYQFKVKKLNVESKGYTLSNYKSNLWLDFGGGVTFFTSIKNKEQYNIGDSFFAIFFEDALLAECVFSCSEYYLPYKLIQKTEKNKEL